MSLGREAQLDWAAGVQRDVAPHLIDPRGAYEIRQGLLADDGSIFKRGGSVAFANAAFGTSLRAVWDGYLLPGRRSLMASTTAFGTLLADDQTPQSVGGAGFGAIPKVMTAFQDLLFIGGGHIYGGSRKAADYSTGTVTVTAGSKTVEGAGGTTFLTSVDVGMLFRVGEERIYVVASVDSDTQLTLRDPYEGLGGGGKAYTLKRLESTAGPYRSADVYAVTGDRLLVCAGKEVWISEIDKPHLYVATVQPSEKQVSNVHDLEEGVTILGARSIGVDQALIFHTGGITRLGNLAQSIVDGFGASQHTIDIFSRDVVLWANQGIADYRGALVVPAVDEIYLVDGVSAPLPVGEAIGPLYRDYVHEGHSPGGGFVHRNHYFLPVLDSSGLPVDLLTCRLDRPFKSRGKTYFPWTFQSGAGGKICAGTVRHPSSVGERPRVMAAGADGVLLDIATFFEPEGGNRNDHDGTTAPFQLITRDYEAGNLAIARFRRLALLYELEAVTGENPQISAEVGLGIRKPGLASWNDVRWDEFEWADPEDTEFTLLPEELATTYAPPNAGNASVLAQNAFEWMMNTRGRHTRYRIQCADPVAKLTIRGLLIFAAETGGVRQMKVA